MSYNVRLAYLFSTVETASMSMRSGDVLSMYILLLTGGHTDAVGLIQGANGLMQLLAALPAGWLADKVRRDRVLFVAAVVGAAASCCMAWALFTDQTVAWIAAGMVLLGVYKGFYNPPMEAIFADSLATGRERDTAYTTRYILQNLANCLGPLQGLVVFAVLGNTWTVPDCRFVLRIGICMTVAPLLLLLCFDDKKTLGLRSESLNSRSRNPSMVSLAGMPADGDRRCCAWMSNLAIMVPAIITLSDLFAALASGMASKFYAVFFVQACGMNPVYSSAIAILGPMSISAFSALVNYLVRFVDRMQLVLVTKALDFSMLTAMAVIPPGDGTREGLVVLHLLRNGIANCSRPMLRSLMMDHVDKKHRGKWNAIDSFRTVSWSGSAMLGGILIQQYGFQETFLVSAAMKFAGWVLLLLLLPLIGRGCGARSSEQHGGEQEEGGYEPLLASDLLDDGSGHGEAAVYPDGHHAQTRQSS